MNKLLISALAILGSVQHVTATYFVNNGDANCTYPVTATVSSIVCSTGDGENKVESEYCTFGDSMFISGEMTLEENLPSSEMCVTTKVCLLSYVCRTYQETMDVCNAVGVSNEADGTACPNAGTFYFGTTAKIPGKPYMKLGSGWGVNVKVIVEDCNKYKNYAFECDTSFSAISSDEAYAGTATTMMVSGAALLGVAAAVAVFIRRRQIMVDNEEQQSGFEMMKDSSAVQA